jgi:hypothetical protein
LPLIVALTAVQTKVAEATAVGLTAQQMVNLCDLATAEILTKGYASYQVAGRTLTFANLQTVNGVRDYYRAVLQSESGGMAMAEAEL